MEDSFFVKRLGEETVAEMDAIWSPEVVEKMRRLSNGYPPLEEQRKAADAISAAYDAIVAMCGPDQACPPPFDEILHVLSRHAFTIARLASADSSGVKCAIPPDGETSGDNRSQTERAPVDAGGADEIAPRLKGDSGDAGS